MRGYAAAGLMVCILLLSHPGAYAQRTQPEVPDSRLTGSPPLAGTIDPHVYRLGPGDLMRLGLTGPISRETALAVTPEGTLFLPDLGAVPVAGLTLEDARARVAARIHGALRGVGVELQLVVPRTFRIYLTG